MREKLYDIIKEFSNAKYVMKILKTMTNTKIRFERKNKPKEMIKEELKYPMNRSIQYQRIKIYVRREQKLDNNIDKIFKYILG